MRCADVRRSRHWYAEDVSTSKHQALTSPADDRSAKHITPESVASLGEVKVQWIWMRRAGVPRLLTGQSKHTPATGESLPEKCLKGRAISQTAKWVSEVCLEASVSLTYHRLGEAKACAAQTSQDATYPYGRQPFATFTFKYRSKRMPSMSRSSCCGC